MVGMLELQDFVLHTSVFASIYSKLKLLIICGLPFTLMIYSQVTSSFLQKKKRCWTI